MFRNLLPVSCCQLHIGNRSREWKLHKLSLKGQISRRDWWPAHDTWSEHKARLSLKYREGIDCAPGTPPYPTESPITALAEYRALTPAVVAREGWLSIKKKESKTRSKKTALSPNQALEHNDLFLYQDKDKKSDNLGKLFLGGSRTSPNRRRSMGTAPK